MAVVQRLEMVRRIADEIEGYVVELGTDGRLLALQLDELMAGVDADRTLVVRDYLPTGAQGPHARRGAGRARPAHRHRAARPVAVAKAIGLPGRADALDAAVSPRGFRLLAKVPRLPAPSSTGWSTTSAACRSCSAPRIDDLQAVDGVGDARARGVREGLSRLAEASILERYV